MGDESNNNNNASPLPQPDVHEDEPLRGGSFDEENSQQTQVSQEQQRPPDTEMCDFNFDEMCEMVMSYKCKNCSFLCQDKPTLITHIKHRHFGGIKRDKSSNQLNVLEDIDNAVFDFSKIKTNKREIGKEEISPVPSIPPTPDAFYPASEEEDDNSCQMLGEENGRSVDLDIISLPIIDRGPLEPDGVEDVFLCAECDIVFASKELCCRHMHEIHGLLQFNAAFIQEAIISKKPGSEGVCAEDSMDVNDDSTTHSKPPVEGRRKKIQLPKYLTLEEGVLVPKKFRVSKSILFSCSKCMIKFESNQVMKLHETCHVDNQHSSSGDVTKTGKNKNLPRLEDKRNCGQDANYGDEDKNPSKNLRLKNGFKCPICEQMEDKSAEVRNRTSKPMNLFLKWSSCATHLWREHKIDCELYSCSVCEKFKNYYITKVKDHERLHKEETNYVCKTCNKKFKQRHQLLCHEKYHKEKLTRLPPPEESRWYTPKECPVCKRILSDAKCLKKHISAVHNKLKPYCCNICGHMTARKAELTLHVRQHTGEKPYKCSLCQFATRDHNSLRKHKMRHGDKRPYACPYCEYRCIQSCAFKNHIVSIHPDQEVVFQCVLCPHSSVNETLFAAHEKDHKEGRIPPQNENRNTSPAPSTDTTDQTNEQSDESSNDYPDIGIKSFEKSTNPWKKPKSLQKPRWLEDDSFDVIDNGGVTIPAINDSAPNDSNSGSRNRDIRTKEKFLTTPTTKSGEIIMTENAPPTTFTGTISSTTCTEMSTIKSLHQGVHQAQSTTFILLSPPASVSDTVQLEDSISESRENTNSPMDVLSRFGCRDDDLITVNLNDIT